MDINERIQERREALGLSDVEVAQRAGLSIHEYCDVEGYPDEFTDVLSVDEAKRLAAVLGLDLLELVGLSCSRCEGESLDPDWLLLSPARLLRVRREGLGLTREQVAVQAGWDDRGAGLELLEDIDASFPGETNIDTVLALSRVLEVPADLLLGVQ